MEAITRSYSLLPLVGISNIGFVFQRHRVYWALGRTPDAACSALAPRTSPLFAFMHFPDMFNLSGPRREVVRLAIHARLTSTSGCTLPPLPRRHFEGTHYADHLA